MARPPYSNEALERSLRSLASTIEYPPAPNVAPAVAARIARAPRRIPGWSFAQVPHPVALGTVALVVAVSVGMLFAPGARRAVADWIGVDGIRISFDGATPTPAELASDLELGDRVSLAEAERLAGFDVKTPAAGLGDPDEVFFDELPGGAAHVSLVYGERPGLPPATAPGGPSVALLVNEFAGSLDPGYFKKTLEDTNVRAVEVEGAQGFFLSGEPHLIYLVGPDGTPLVESARLAANVLLWEVGGVTYRVESTLGLERSLEIAESLR